MIGDLALNFMWFIVSMYILLSMILAKVVVFSAISQKVTPLDLVEDFLLKCKPANLLEKVAVVGLIPTWIFIVIFHLIYLGIRRLFNKTKS